MSQTIGTILKGSIIQSSGIRFAESWYHQILPKFSSQKSDKFLSKFAEIGETIHSHIHIYYLQGMVSPKYLVQNVSGVDQF